MVATVMMVAVMTMAETMDGFESGGGDGGDGGSNGGGRDGGSISGGGGDGGAGGDAAFTVGLGVARRVPLLCSPALRMESREERCAARYTDAMPYGTLCRSP
ncbi:unnamed protein product [Lampetra fluviatilis]